MPIWAIDLDGLEELIYTKNFKKYGDDLECSVQRSDHLNQIVQSVSDPEKAANVKVYFAVSSSQFSSENGYTGDLVQISKFVKAFEDAYSQNFGDFSWEMQQLNNENKSYEKYLSFTDLFDKNEIDYEVIINNAENNKDYEAFIIVIKSAQFGGEPESEVMKTFFHEVEQHLQRVLGVRENADGDNTGEGDHNHMFDFQKYKRHYEKRGYTQEDVDAGFSPKREDINRSSPTGKTNREIDKIDY